MIFNSFPFLFAFLPVVLTGTFLLARAGAGAAATPPSSQCLQARFSRLVTTTKYLAGSASSCSLTSYPITAVGWPHAEQVHCSGAQAITRSTRGNSAGNSCRPGCLRRFRLSAGSGSGSRTLSAWTSTLLTPGSSSSRLSCASESFSLPGPYFLIRCSRNCASSAWIFRCAHASSSFNATFSSASDLTGLESVAFTASKS